MSSQNSPINDRSEQAGKQKLKILFLCTGNTCRSQMAEGMTRHLKSDIIEPYSAGVDPGVMNTRAVKSMAEIGIDISSGFPKTIESLGHIAFDYVITLCDQANESCPLFPGKTKRLHWGFEDPPKLAENAATENEAMVHYRRVRDEIKSLVEKLPDVLND
ncbi:MAG: arsenate reductase ArsC [Deltaproteobacteria bacterium]|nr:arsenate reductase ArsC [Deltaproteobacteria bacterium]